MVHGGIIPIFDAKMAIFHVSLDAKLQFSVEICREFWTTVTFRLVFIAVIARKYYQLGLRNQK